MFPIINFDPEDAASILEALAEDLRVDPDLVRVLELGPHLSAAVAAARAWAAEHHIPGACIPEVPGPETLTGEGVLVFMTGLAACLRYLSGQVRLVLLAPPVLGLLRASDEGALLELREFEDVVSEMVENLTVVTTDLRALDYELVRIDGDGIERSEAIRRARERAGRAWFYAEQVVDRLDEVHASLKASRLRRHSTN